MPIFSWSHILIQYFGLFQTWFGVGVDTINGLISVIGSSALYGYISSALSGYIYDSAPLGTHCVGQDIKQTLVTAMLTSSFTLF